MSLYRLELWFDINVPGTLNWGVVKSDDNDYRFNSGGTARPKTNGVVKIDDGLASTFDVYLFDVSNDRTARDLQWIQIDWEYQGGNPNPIVDAPALRAGMTGTAFHSNASGTTNNGPEEKIYSNGPPPISTQRRWSLARGYSQLADGHFTFKGSARVGPPGTTEGGTTFAFDPEMDVNN